MKNSTSSNVCAIALGLVLSSNTTLADNPNPKIIPPQAHPGGKTYGEWSALWWQWALSIPADSNPLLDPSGENCAIGQSGRVWFLAGNFGGTDVRQCTVPAGKMLFFPVINTFWLTTCASEPRTQDGIRPLVAPFIDAAENMTAEVDGELLEDLGRYRAESPLFCTSLELFEIRSPDDFAGFCADGDPVVSDCSDLPNPEEHYGTYDGFGPTMSDGYWIMLAPLPVGEHTIRFAATSLDGFAVDVMYHLTVAANR